MSILDAIIQGIVQGLTEFLPVSSSGHLSITQHILGATENNLFFNVMLHVGTLVAVVAFYHKLMVKSNYRYKCSHMEHNIKEKVIFRCAQNMLCNRKMSAARYRQKLC